MNLSAAKSAADAAKTKLKTERTVRVVHLVSSLHVGGMEQFVVRIAAAQQKRGNHVSILALQAGGALRAEAEKAGLHVVELGGKTKHLRIVRGALALSRLRPDILHAHNVTSLHYALLGKRVGNAKIVLTGHGRGKGGGREFGPDAWAGVNAVVPVSEAVAQEMRPDVPAGRLRVILNGVEHAPAKRSRAEVRAELGLTDELTGIIVARIDHLKGHSDLIAAWAKLRETGLAPTLLVAGDGANRAEIEQQARDKNLDTIRFLGFRSDVPDLLEAADFFVLPSLTEGLPLSVLEAMAHRLPVVATHVGGIPEVVEAEKTGLLVPPQDPNALADAIRRLATDADLRETFAAAGHRRVVETFSFEAMLDRYALLYADLLATP